MLTDTHVHLDDKAYQGDLDQVIDNASELGFILNPGCDLTSSRKAIEISQSNPKIYAAVGIHPMETGNYSNKSIAELRELAQNNKVVAIGEIGLDYHYPDNPSPEEQKLAFREQIQLARDLNLPYIVHDRQAHQDVLQIIEENPDINCVVHAYSGSPEMAQRLIENGHYISVGGVLTFKNARDLPKVVKEIPLERIMLETDGPYLTPVPFRGKRNEPAYTSYVAEAIARIKGLTVEAVLQQTAQNARDFFKVEF